MVRGGPSHHECRGTQIRTGIKWSFIRPPIFVGVLGIGPSHHGPKPCVLPVYDTPLYWWADRPLVLPLHYAPLIPKHHTFYYTYSQYSPQ